MMGDDDEINHTKKLQHPVEPDPCPLSPIGEHRATAVRGRRGGGRGVVIRVVLSSISSRSDYASRVWAAPKSKLQSEQDNDADDDDDDDNISASLPLPLRDGTSHRRPTVANHLPQKSARAQI
ncbi:hypothetical protein ZHAS_00013121 [Anopheles sinensis]|uniref:Uncharacterized protein n=1 Tax=Anopheles sinensis TaxID=74873 RepID=A0A084W4M0_ANOSI|nr:hypothetical protein ZHAS_00013121 [Anopheles sinensis]